MTPASIWWCEKHLASGWGGGRAKWCHLAPATDEKSDNYACRVVQRLLVDPSALVVERPDGFTDAEWESAREYFTDLFSEFLAGGARREASHMTPEARR